MTLSDVEQLARWRRLGARHSEEVVDIAMRVLKKGGLGEDQWAIREQLAIAALDIGRSDVAQRQFARMAIRFKASPRVDILVGLQLEARGEFEKAKEAYSGLLKVSETNIPAHQRLIALQLNNPSAAITSLLSYLDIFYSDPNGWSLLAELYADLGLYPQSLTALGHLLVIQAWDSAAVCRAGETAYTMGDYQLALKYFLRATEMQTDPSSPGAKEESCRTRSWWGVKLSLRRLMSDAAAENDTSVPEEMATKPTLLQALDALATERLLAADGKGLSARRAVLSASQPAAR
ncbi:hypothetical protein BD324DRAFT_612908 [Kockovaella imperatae]|uniref:ER membrane protein complex subunit 2 n=1 Tax=Kockovaella imperatae TaxID=4999 RepID=A0A1Y1USN3_9TREE|nr:hypothetical protein BD324DRAFT_612908 [Kockovaella imperatae]ORX41019.1 hypothetical protein BD324DRAFT_612908 [Kockovaella imperatae]